MAYQALFTLPKWRKKQEQIEWLSQDLSLSGQNSDCSNELETAFQALFRGDISQLEDDTLQLDIPKELPIKAKTKSSTVVNQTEQLQNFF